MAVTSTTHAQLQIVILNKRPPVRAGILNALIRMDQHLVFRLPSPEGHHQGIDYQVGLGATLHTPANNLSRKQVHNNSEIQPAFVSADICEISYPRLVRLVYFKFSIQNVRRYVAKVATFKPSVPFVTTLRAQTGLLHDSVNAIFAASLTVVFHVQRDGPVAIGKTAFNPELLNLAQQALIFYSSGTIRLLLPCVKTTGMYLLGPDT